MTRLPLLAAVAAALLATAPAALAGGPGSWTRLSPPTQSNIDQPGYARTDDDSLQVLWNAPTAGNSAHDDVFRSNISRNGTLIGSNPVETNWAGMSSPALVAEADLLHIDAFFGGQRTTDSGETNSNLNWSHSEDRGEQWQLLPGTIAENGAPYASPMSAARLGNVFWQAWGGTGLGAFSHRGLDKAVPALNLQDRIGGGCCGYDANIAAEPVSNRVAAAWYSNSSDAPGVWVQALSAASGDPIDVPQRMPGSVTSFGGSLESTSIGHRVPMATLPPGGFFIAYPSGYPSPQKVLVWRVGASAARKVGINAVDLTGTTISASSDNRLWLAWSRSIRGKRRIVARRSNPGAGKWGQPVVVKPPSGTSSFWSLYGEANPSGVLDTLAVVTTPAGLATWHSQIEPGLTFTGPAKLKRNENNKAVFTIDDAGDPLAGVTVKVAGHTKKTDSDGNVTFALGPFGKHVKRVVAKATLDGYAAGKLSVPVKK